MSVKADAQRSLTRSECRLTSVWQQLDAASPEAKVVQASINYVRACCFRLENGTPTAEELQDDMFAITEMEVQADNFILQSAQSSAQSSTSPSRILVFDGTGRDPRPSEAGTLAVEQWTPMIPTNEERQRQERDDLAIAIALASLNRSSWPMDHRRNRHRKIITEKSTLKNHHRTE